MTNTCLPSGSRKRQTFCSTPFTPIFLGKHKRYGPGVFRAARHVSGCAGKKHREEEALFPSFPVLATQQKERAQQCARSFLLYFALSAFTSCATGVSPGTFPGRKTVSATDPPPSPILRRVPPCSKSSDPAPLPSEPFGGGGPGF